MNKNELISTVEKAKKGNKEAFETLYSAYYQKLYCFVLKNVCKKEAAEDITQETFLRSMEKIDGLKNPEHYDTWLHSIAYNSCMDMFRSQKRNAYFDNSEDMERAIDNTDLNEPIMVPEDYMINKDRAAQLRAMIDSLNPDVRSALILYYYDDMNVAQVADALGMKENLAKQKLFRGRKKLKDKIQQLQERGILLCAMPLGELMKNTVTTKQAAACRAAYSATAHGTLLAGKIIGVSTAAVLAVSVPFILHKVHNTGIVTDNSSAAEHRNDIPDIRNESSDTFSSNAADDSIETETASAAPANGDIAESSAFESSAADSSSAAEEAAVDWKTAYKDYISAGEYRNLTQGFSDITTGENQMITDSNASFNLAYIDEDDVPELLVTGGQSVHILTYKDGNISHIKTDDDNGNIGWYGKIQIVEKQGLFLDDYQNMGTYTTPVYKLSGSQATLMSNIEYYWNRSENTEKFVVGSDEVSEGTYLDELIKYKLNTYFIENHSEYYIKDDNWTLIDGVCGIETVNDFIDNFDAANRSGYRYSKDIYAEYAEMSDSSSSESKTDSSTAEKKETVPVEMSVDKMLNTSVDDLLALTNNDYEFVQIQGQDEGYGFRCAAFPEYIFSVDQQYKDGAASGPFDVPANVDPENRHVELNGKKIMQIEVWEGGYIGNGITVGMSYNEIKELMGGKLEVGVSNSSLGLPATVEIDGRTWLLHFDITREQHNEIRRRIEAKVPGEIKDYLDVVKYSEDISDINPKCDIAVWNYHD